MNTDVQTPAPIKPLGAGWSCFIVATALTTVMAGLMAWFGIACNDGDAGWALVAVLVWFVGLHLMALVLLLLVTLGTLALRVLCRAWHCSPRVALLMLALPPASAASCAAFAALVHAQERCSIGF